MSGRRGLESGLADFALYRVTPNNSVPPQLVKSDKEFRVLKVLVFGFGLLSDQGIEFRAFIIFIQ